MIPPAPPTGHHAEPDEAEMHLLERRIAVMVRAILEEHPNTTCPACVLAMVEAVLMREAHGPGLSGVVLAPSSIALH